MNIDMQGYWGSITLNKGKIFWFIEKKLHARGRAPTNLLLVDLIAGRVLHIGLNINLILAKSQALFKTDVIFSFFEMLNEAENSWYLSWPCLHLLPGCYFSIVDHFSKKILSELVQIKYSIRISFLQNLVQIENHIWTSSDRKSYPNRFFTITYSNRKSYLHAFLQEIIRTQILIWKCFKPKILSSF